MRRMPLLPYARVFARLQIGRFRRSIGACAILGLWLAAGATMAAPSSEMQRGEHIAVELLSEVKTVGAGEPFWVALRLVPDQGWHTYWRNPGDSGLETRIRWTLPAGASAGEIHWPLPQRLPVAHIVNYGMEGETLLLTKIQPGKRPVAETLHIRAHAAWLVCQEECVPGFVELELTLPVGTRLEPASEHREAFDAARARLPQDAPAHWRAGFDTAGNRLSLKLLTGPDTPPADATVHFFPIRTDLLDHSAPQEREFIPGGIRLEQALSALFRVDPETVDGVLVFERAGTAEGYWLQAESGLPASRETDTRRADAADSRPVVVRDTPVPAADPPAEPADEARIAAWEPFSEVRLDELRGTGRAVFVNMTADWCVTCRANERRALDTPEVRAALLRGDVAYLKGDWTDQDPEITEYLARYRSRGVPLYVLYPPGVDAKPRRLPAMLTTELVVQAIETALADPAGMQP